MRWRTACITLVVLAVSTFGLAVAEPARAEASLPFTGVSYVRPLLRTGVEERVAEAHGYEVRIDSAGVEYAVPKGSPRALDNEVPGDCGSSWIYFTAVDTARHYATVYTGFRLLEGRAGAVNVDWNIVIVDNYGVSSKRRTRPLLSEHFWYWNVPFTAGGPTQATTWVEQFSYVILWDGTVCFSHGPWDQKYL